jgi:P-type E1-E2 ATPase
MMVVLLLVSSYLKGEIVYSEIVPVFLISIANSLFCMFVETMRGSQKWQNIQNCIEVIRDGKNLKISPENVVVGDIMLVKKGMEIPADCILIEADKLYMDE